MIKNKLSWGEYFMALAILSSYRSKDPCTKVGACIVNPQNKRVLSLGYNGMPHVPNNDKIFPWEKGNEKEEDNKYVYVVHAELNAILSAGKDLTGATLYVTHSPCHECAKAIIQSGIKKVVYMNEYSKDIIPTKRMFKAANIDMELFRNISITIDVESMSEYYDKEYKPTSTGGITITGPTNQPLKNTVCHLPTIIIADEDVPKIYYQTQSSTTTTFDDIVTTTMPRGAVVTSVDNKVNDYSTFIMDRFNKID